MNIGGAIGSWFKGPDAKELGNDAFKEKDMVEAIYHYSNGLDQCQGTAQAPERMKLLANRSAALVSIEQYKEALADAEECCRIAPEWPKGWARKGKALTCLGKHKLAASAYARGLEASLKSADSASERHEKDMEALKRQADSASDMYLKLLDENQALKAQLADYECMFTGDAVGLKAKPG